MSRDDRDNVLKESWGVPKLKTALTWESHSGSARHTSDNAFTSQGGRLENHKQKSSQGLKLQA